MDEDERIARVVGAAGARLHAGPDGPGDDAAVLPWADGDLVVTTDAVVEGVHFWPEADPRDVGRFAAAVNLSDLAAMGAAPRAFLLASVQPPQSPPAWLEDVARGVGEMIGRHGARLVGGDLKPGAVRALVGVALGAVPAGRAVTRAGARVGDAVVATGPFGDVGAWLERVRRGDTTREVASRHILRVEPRVPVGIALRSAGATALVDTSDGLARAASLVAAASGVRIMLDAQRVPRGAVFDAVFGAPRFHDHAYRAALFAVGGEYELLATLPAAAVPRVPGLVVVGRVERGSGVVLHDGETAAELDVAGFRHFSPAVPQDIAPKNDI